jgi:hypothetical protein
MFHAVYMTPRKRRIEEAIKKASLFGRVRAKYVWLARYYNEVAKESLVARPLTFSQTANVGLAVLSPDGASGDSAPKLLGLVRGRSCWCKRCANT